MGVSLSKGGNVSLSKAAPGLTAVLVGLGWDVRTTTGTDYDLDASALLLDASGKVLSDRHFVFYNNSPPGRFGRAHRRQPHRRGRGRRRVGQGEPGDRTAEVDRIVFPVSIHDAENRARASARVANAFIAWSTRRRRRDRPLRPVRGRLHRDGDGLRRAVTATAPEWKFRAVGQGYASGLAGIAADFGVNV
nr:TerD family protein [Streptomyces sp. LBUM 1486]